MNKNFRVYTKKRLNYGKRNFFSKFGAISITNLLIFINIIVFIITLLLMIIVGQEKILSFLSLQATAFWSGLALWTLLTSMFMHAGFLHLFVNMISLFFLGNFVEKLIGRKRFLWFYLIAGLFAGLFFVLLAYLFGNTDLGMRIFGNPDVFSLGASGAIFGLAGLLTVLIPNLRVYAFFILPMRMWHAMIVFLGVLWVASAFGSWPIGNSAHFGGFLVGVVYGAYLRKKYKRKTRLISKYFSR